MPRQYRKIRIQTEVSEEDEPAIFLFFEFGYTRSWDSWSQLAERFAPVTIVAPAPKAMNLVL